MMTSRAEYRLRLRQDNADYRLTEKGRSLGLVSDTRYRRYCEKYEHVEKIRRTLANNAKAEALQKLFAHLQEDMPQNGISFVELLTRNIITFQDINLCFDEFSGYTPSELYTVDVGVNYEGYLKKQEAQIAQAEKFENRPIPKNFDFAQVSGLRIEARQKLADIQPLTLGQASRISGVSPADCMVLLLALEKAQSQTKSE